MKEINSWTKLRIGTVAALLPAGPCLFAQTTGKVLLINRRNRQATISLPGAVGSSEHYVNEEAA